MTTDIRPLHPEEMPQFNELVAIVFGGEPPPSDPPATDDNFVLPEWTLCALEDGRLASSYAAFPFHIRLNGVAAPAAGVTCVGTHPAFRRRGNLRRITEMDFRNRYERKEQPIAILTASLAAIYHRYGYAVASTSQRGVIDPRDIAFKPDAPPARGGVRRATRDEMPLLKQLYREFIEPRNGYIHRGDPMWQRNIIGGARNLGMPLLAVYEEDGRPTGYIAWSAAWREQGNLWSGDDGPPGQRLWVRDFAWLTPAAHRGLWEFLKSFDLIVRAHHAMPVDDPAFHTFIEPRRLNLKAHDHLLARVIDVERALPLRPYGREGRITFRVTDTLCPWNDGVWELEAGSDGARARRSTSSPEVSMPVSTLAMLLFGQISATQAVRYGLAEAEPGAPLKAWDDLWRTGYAPFCADTF